jgi:Phytanoyl-CoA dioxygenase (PhyH)
MTMTTNDAWFDSIAASPALSIPELCSLQENGFIVTKGPVRKDDLAALSRPYDSAVSQADPADVWFGSTTTRVTDCVNRGVEFDKIYVHAPLLDACCRIIQRPFRLSTVVARTLRAGKSPSKLHVDFPSDDRHWPMVGFIFMVDKFRPENGATRFLPGSQGMLEASNLLEASVPACGPAGSMILYNGSVWHAHGPILTDVPRRSIQGAFIRRAERPALDWHSRMRPEVLSRLSPLATYLLDL